jgi:UDPglucose 6-dehydrogenase
MHIGVIGAGYVGLTTGICLAESGNTVAFHDRDTDRLAQLRRGELPIYEPGLGELLENNLRAGRLAFHDALSPLVEHCEILFIAVGTPPMSDGRPDVRAVEEIAMSIVRTMPAPRVIVLKSTVPVGTNARLAPLLTPHATTSFDLVSNPEFLKEGTAVDDFLKPDRVVIGTNSPHAANLMQELYAPFLRTGKPILVLSPTSSEMTKYAANAMLSTKISFINEIANLCERLGADITEVRTGICTDSRIGFQFLHPGLGFGGSCFPKDIQALVRLCDDVGYRGALLSAVREVNEDQKCTLQRKLRQHFRDGWAGLTVAVWGLSYKPRTDDIRESPALGLIADLLADGASVAVHDPQAMENARRVFGDRIRYGQNMIEPLAGADALCIVTEWNEYRTPDFQLMHQTMRQAVVFDGRNLYDPARMAERGFYYHGVGRNLLPKCCG